MSSFRIALGALAPLTILAFPSTALAQGSDNCSSAQAISGLGPFPFDLTSATTGSEGQANGACNVNGSMAILNDVWFQWTAPGAGTYILTTCLQTTVDTKVAIYAGTTCPPGPPVSCDDDSGSAQSVDRFFATSGQPFLFQIGTSPFGSPGTGTFRVLPVATATCDDCATPDVLSSTGMHAFDDTLASTGTQGQSNPNCPHVHNDLWFTWVAPGSGMAHLNTCGQTNADTAVSVYDGSGCPVATAIACDDDGCGLQSIVQWPPVAGASYTLQIGLSGGVSGSWGTFDLEQDAPPANDDCATPTILPGGGGTSYDNSTATTGSQGQGTACGAIERDLWFTWTASITGTATIETCFQTAANTIIAVYPGAGCPSAPELGCNDDACGGVTSSVTVPISANVAYTIQIGSPPGAPPGPASFTITETPGTGPITSYCFGDGTGTACPCGNQGAPRRGCANSVNPSGARLDSIGTASVSADSFEVRGVGMPPGSTAVYFQGTTRTNNGAGVISGDGLRCASGSLIRLGYKVNSAGGSSGYGAPLGDTPISIRGGIPPAGATRDYQIYYRNPAAFCTPATYNLSNGLEVVWTP